MPHSATRRLIWLGLPLAIIALVVTGGFLIWEARTITSLQTRIASLSRENGQLLGQIENVRRQIALPPTPAASVPAPKCPPQDGSTAALTAAEQQGQRLRESLANANAELTHLQARVSELETLAGSAAEENRRLSAAVEERRKDVEEAKRDTEALRAEVKADALRVADLEKLNAKLKDDAATMKQASAQTQQTVSDLEGIFHRRENYLNNVLRRYKDITEQYRAASGVRDGRDRESTTIGAAEISRIQNSVALAEEDLKQISALSAQAERLQKKLPIR